MKRLFGILFVIVSFALMQACSSCKKIGDINVNKYKIVSLRPEGLRNIVGTISIEQTNNGPAVTVTSLDGEVYDGDSVLGTVTLTEPLIIPGPGTCWTDINARIALDPSLSALSIVRLLRNPDPSNLNVSFRAVVKMGALKVVIKKKNVPLSRLVRK